MATPISTTAEQRTAIQEAARWFAKLQAHQANDVVQADWLTWLARHPENRKAWAKVQAVQQQFAAVPSHVALPTLQNVSRGRRQMLRGAILGGALIPFGMWMAKDAHRARWTADYRTAVGEIASLPLPDGTVAILDTQSAVDVQYTHDVRRIILRAGRLYIDTHPDNAVHPRPFIVQTRHGDIEALGTEFAVRVTNDCSKVSVNQHAVRITGKGAPQSSLMLQAGHRATFTNGNVSPQISTLQDDVTASGYASWRKGSLIATNMPLAHFVHRFQAYRQGYLFVDDSLAQLPVSGVFPLANSELALAALENTYPVQIRHLTRYLTWIEPRA